MKILCAGKNNSIIDMSCAEFTGLLWMAEMASESFAHTERSWADVTSEEIHGGILPANLEMVKEARKALQSLRESFAKHGAMSCERQTEVAVVSVPAAAK